MLQAFEQRGVADIRPLALALARQIQLAQQGDPRLPLTQLRRPRQQFQTLAPDQIDQRLTAGGFIEAGQRFAAENQFPDLALTLGPQHAFAFVPIQLVNHAHLFGQHRVEQCRIEIRRQINPFFTLALTTAEVGDHQPGLLHQAVCFGEQGCTAVGQTILGTARASLLGDAIGIGQCQQRAEPARVIGIADRLRCLAAQIASILPRQLPRPLHPALGTASGARLAGQQHQSAVQIRAGTAQDVALAKQRRDIAGHVCQTQGLAAQQ